MKRWIALLSACGMAVMLLGVGAPLAAGAEETAAETAVDTSFADAGNTQSAEPPVPSYKEYAPKEQEIGNEKQVTVDISQPAVLGEGAEAGETQGKSGVCFVQDGAFAQWTVEVPQAGYYHMEIDYCPLEGKQTDIQMAVYLNGQLPFEEAYLFLLKRSYADAAGIRQDFRGNDIRPGKQEVYEWSAVTLKDKDGVYTDPYYFYFKEGQNTLCLKALSANVCVGALRLYDEAPPGTYADYARAYAGCADTDEPVSLLLQGETPYRTTDTVLYATYDRQSSATLSADGSLNDAAKLRLNTVGQSTWKNTGQAITWQFTVDKGGFYEIGMRVRQNEKRGVFSVREIRIDGVVPFSELSAVRFAYAAGWQLVTLGGEEPYRFYLEPGPHTVTMEVVTGELGKYVQAFEDLILELNALYREIIQITGTAPDSYRDYKLESEIPDLQTRFQGFADRLRVLQREMEELGIQSGSDMVVAEQLAVQLESFIKQPRTVATRISNFQDNISSLSSWVLSLVSQPLEIDYLFVQTPGAKAYAADNGWLSTLGFRFRCFLSTFVEDYSTLSDEAALTDKDPLDVWIGLGRDQAQIVKDLIDNRYTPEYGVYVRLSLVQQGIMEAIAAGKAPDVLLYTGDVVNLAARHAAVELSRFDGFDGLVRSFHKDALVPYTYEGGVYAVPLTQDYLMLFYRTDIFEELGLALPTTWEEFNHTVMALQKKNFTAGVPVGTATAADISVFATLLAQRGENLYNEDSSATTFESENAIEAFTYWTEFYRKYRLPQSYTLLTRFRSGEMPLAIANYSTYNTLALSAPEITGLWEMAMLPGRVNEDGTLNQASVSATTPALILSGCDRPETAFSFIRWFASAKIQTSYGLAVENVLGVGARYTPANLEALESLNWTADELAVLKSQMDQSAFMEQIPATYYVTRCLTNAYRAVTVSGKNAREALYSYNIDINNEITRKRQELGLE